MMIHLLLLYLPCTFCLGFLLIYIMRKDYSLLHRMVSIIAALLTIHFFANSQYLSNFEYYNTLTWSLLVKHFTTPFLPFVGLMYLILLAGKKIKVWQYVTFITIPVLVGTACVTIYLMIGINGIATYLEDIEKAGHISEKYSSDMLYGAFEIVCQTAYDIILWIEGAILSLCTLRFLHQSGCRRKNLAAFLLGRGTLSPLQLQSILSICLTAVCITRTLYTRWFFLEHPYISDILSIIAALLCIGFLFTGLYSQLAALNIGIFVAPVRGSMTELAAVSSEYQMSRSENLLERFRTLMETQKPYLRYSLRLEDLAAMLQTNRQYLSHLINTEYKQSFPDFINSLRIKHAQTYMLNHPNATQDNIARNSGFNSAQTFNRRFKIETGETPAEWLSNKHR